MWGCLVRKIEVYLAWQLCFAAEIGRLGLGDLTFSITLLKVAAGYRGSQALGSGEGEVYSGRSCSFRQ